MSETRAAIVVPWRPGVRDRERAWEWCRVWWERTGYPIHVVEHTGSEPFNRAWCINEGARRAWPWDVIIAIDADVIEGSVEQVHQAVETAQRTGAMTVAHTAGRDLSVIGTRKLLRGDEFVWEENLAGMREVCDSRVNVLRADLFELLGGYDVRFEGWGHEDVAAFSAAECARGPAQRIPGSSWHLWHEPMLGRSQKTREWRRGRSLNDRYAYAARRGFAEVQKVMNGRRAADVWAPPKPTDRSERRPWRRT